MSGRFAARTRPTSLVSTWENNSGGRKPWWATVGQDTTNFASVSVSAPVSINTKGAWTELIASTSTNADMVLLSVSVSQSGQNSATLIDLAIGAAGSEVAFLSDMAVGSWSSYRVFIPYAINSGSRISARIQSAVASKVASVQIQTINTGAYADAPTSLTVMGSDTATSAGTDTTNNTWVQVTSSTSSAFSAIVLVPSASSSSMGTSNVKVELGVGAAGSEESIGSVVINVSSAEAVLQTYNGMSIIGRQFLAGSRLSVRVDNSGGTVDACLIGIP